MRWGQIATGAIAISALAFFALVVGQSQSIQWSEIPAIWWILRSCAACC